MASENREKKPIVIERRRGKDRKKTPRLTKTYDVTIIPATVGIVAETEEPPKKRVSRVSATLRLLWVTSMFTSIWQRTVAVLVVSRAAISSSPNMPAPAMVS